MSDDSSPRGAGDWLLDLCVYAPIGFALEAHKYLPEFVDRGRSQVALARFVGKFAVDRLEQQFGPLGSFLRTTAEPPAGPVTEPPAGERPAEADVVEPEAPAATDAGVDEPDRSDVPDESSLALHGYGTLSASQIVPRLATLEREDLEAIGRYERANRARRTILNRVEQLLAQR